MKLNYKRTILIGMAFMSISAFWQMYDNVVPLVLSNSFHLDETLTGAIMAADNLLALFLLPIFGSISDKVKTPWGKRMPFIVIGTTLAVILLMILPFADNTRNLPLFIGGLFLVLISMGTYRSPAVALMPDLTPKNLRSRANAVINLMGAVGGVYTLIMISTVVGSGETPNYYPLAIAVATFMVICVALLFFTIKENKLHEAALMVKSSLKDVKKNFDASEFGGAPILGIARPVIKGHGSSDAKAFKNAIRQAIAFSETDLTAELTEALARLSAKKKAERAAEEKKEET